MDGVAYQKLTQWATPMVDLPWPPGDKWPDQNNAEEGKPSWEVLGPHVLIILYQDTECNTKLYVPSAFTLVKNA